MPISDRHPLLDKQIEKATIASNIIEDNVTHYVPRLDGQTENEFNAYVGRPVLHNFTNRVLQGLNGLVFGKDIKVDVSQTLSNMLQDISLSNTTVTDLVGDLFAEVMIKGRVGLLVDMAHAKEGLTKAEAESRNLRPYISKYAHDTIINWKYTNINNEIKLTLLVLKESRLVDNGDEFSHDSEVVYRVLRLVDGVYTVDLYSEEGKQLQETISPYMGGKTMNFIPFISITPEFLSLTPEKPPMYDIASVNLAYFKVDVDYYHGMHFTALPTPYGAGISIDKDEKVKVGSTSFMMFPDPQAKLSYLEFKGDGLGTHEREKENLFNSIVALSGTLLKNDQRRESENTVRMRNNSQYSSLSSTANTISRGITKALEYMEMWAGGTQKVEFQLNTDFTDITADAQTIAATVNAWLSGSLSDREIFDKFKQDGVIVNQNKTFDEHLSEIEVNRVDVI